MTLSFYNSPSLSLHHSVVFFWHSSTYTSSSWTAWRMETNSSVAVLSFCFLLLFSSVAWWFIQWFRGLNCQAAISQDAVGGRPVEETHWYVEWRRWWFTKDPWASWGVMMRHTDRRQSRDSGLKPPSFVIWQEKKPTRKSEEKELYSVRNGVITPVSCDIWEHLQAWDLVCATLHFQGYFCTPFLSQLHMLKSQCGFLQGVIAEICGATLNLTPLRWAATEDHGPAVATQAPQRLPAPVDLRQSHCRRYLLPHFLLPGCSNAAPAQPATLLPPWVGGKRAPTTSCWRERGETKRGNWGDW